MNQYLDEIQQVVDAFKAHALPMLIIVGVLFAIHIVNAMLRYRLNILGILPRHPWGLMGIIFSPFLHGDFTHLLFNAIPLFILGDFVMMDGWAHFVGVTVLIILLSGIFIWLIGRKAFHIGASGVVMGYFGYLLANAYVKPSVATIAVLVVSLYYFGSLIFSLFPTDVKVSWEAHLSGFAAGIFTAFLLVYLK